MIYCSFCRRYHLPILGKLVGPEAGYSTLDPETKYEKRIAGIKSRNAYYASGSCRFEKDMKKHEDTWLERVTLDPVFDEYDPSEKNKNNDCKDFLEK